LNITSSALFDFRLKSLNEWTHSRLLSPWNRLSGNYRCKVKFLRWETLLLTTMNQRKSIAISNHTIWLVRNENDAYRCEVHNQWSSLNERLAIEFCHINRFYFDSFFTKRSIVVFVAYTLERIGRCWNTLRFVGIFARRTQASVV